MESYNVHEECEFQNKHFLLCHCHHDVYGKSLQPQLLVATWVVYRFPLGFLPTLPLSVVPLQLS